MMSADGPDDGAAQPTPPDGLSITWLNHAAVLVESGPIRLLTDPWFEGTCFAGGWQLARHEPRAWALAARATHLWISHWHSDHFHGPTLRRLARENPDVEVLANRSANFDMGPALARFGFRNITALPERAPTPIGGGAEVLRIPTAGIDNMLALRVGRWTVLDYNDCNLPRAALTRIAEGLRRRYGPIDVLLSNYNHAGRLFEIGAPTAIADTFWEGYLGVLDATEPVWSLPFASSHRYIGDGRDQNASMTTLEDLPGRIADSRHHARIVPWAIGDRISWPDPDAEPAHTPRTPALRVEPITPRDYGPPVPWGVLRGAAQRRLATLDRAFFGFTRLVGELVVYARDHDRRLRLVPGVGALDAGRGRGDAHLTAHSRALHDWLGRRFGDDTFLAGAHFTLTDRDPAAVQRWLLPAVLEASELDPRHAMRWLLTREGRRFFWNRREEIAATVSGRRLFAGGLRF